MGEITVTYSILVNDSCISFEDLNELSQDIREHLVSSYLSWEQHLFKTSAYHTLNDSLKLDSKELIDITFVKTD